MNPQSKALHNSITPSKVSKKQLRTEKVPFLRKIAKKEEEGNQIAKKFGSFEERLKNFSNYKK